MRAPPRKPRLFAPALAVGLALFGLAGTQAEAQSASKRVAPAHVSAPSRQSNDAYNRDVRIHNQTGWPMTYLYASSGGDWSDDLLGSGVLAPGQSVVVTIDDGSGACRYSLRAEFDNGQSLQRNGVNACQVADYYFTR
ncbi:hypothetical protein [Brevundimonas sp.]|uniref:hypothetical protein n=1 Tax=Brevundimonas sp. TaxID=1871086 RepID=UPI00286AD021|nr:hypothetical protein [Brevundimonas sp.]